MSFQQISVQGLHEKTKTLGKNEIILDVRGPDEFAEGHIPGARNIPHEDVTLHAAELRRYEKIYIHCRSGKRAQFAFAELEKQGLKNLVCIAEGGMLDWESLGYETVQGTSG